MTNYYAEFIEQRAEKHQRVAERYDELEDEIDRVIRQSSGADIRVYEDTDDGSFVIELRYDLAL